MIWIVTGQSWISSFVFIHQVVVQVVVMRERTDEDGKRFECLIVSVVDKLILLTQSCNLLFVLSNRVQILNSTIAKKPEQFPFHAFSMVNGQFVPLVCINCKAASVGVVVVRTKCQSRRHRMQISHLSNSKLLVLFYLFIYFLLSKSEFWLLGKGNGHIIFFQLWNNCMSRAELSVVEQMPPF